jgi:hypothetical protein
MLYIPRSLDDWHETALGEVYRAMNATALRHHFAADLRAAEARYWQRRVDS